MTNAQKNEIIEKTARGILDTLSTHSILVLDGRGGGPGFCNASDACVKAGLMNDADGELSDVGREVLRLAKTYGEI